MQEGAEKRPDLRYILADLAVWFPGIPVFEPDGRVYQRRQSDLGIQLLSDPDFCGFGCKALPGMEEKADSGGRCAAVRRIASVASGVRHLVFWRASLWTALCKIADAARASSGERTARHMIQFGNIRQNKETE